MAEESAQAEPQEAKKGKSKLLVILLAILVLAGGGGGAAWYLGLLSGGGHDAEAREEEHQQHEKAPAVGALLPLDPFIANLADEEGKRYLKATLQVEFFEAHVPPDFNARLPQMRDLLLTLLSSKLFEEIRTPQGKALLREEIINRMNRAVGKDLVKAVYFTEFIVQ
jgi:flagellar FliL protein